MHISLNYYFLFLHEWCISVEEKTENTKALNITFSQVRRNFPVRILHSLNKTIRKWTNGNKSMIWIEQNISGIAILGMLYICNQFNCSLMCASFQWRRSPDAFMFEQNCMYIRFCNVRYWIVLYCFFQLCILILIAQNPIYIKYVWYSYLYFITSYCNVFNRVTVILVQRQNSKVL